MKIYEQLSRMKILAGINENVGNTVTAFHGTRTDLPFEKFDSTMIGTGLVSASSGAKYGGFFFTSDIENAEYYTEYFLCRVEITNVFPNPLNDRHSPTVLKKAVEDNRIYHTTDYLDGSTVSDITVVPSSQLNNVRILEWIFVGDEEWLFKRYDEFFGGEPDEDDEEGGVFVNQDLIEEMLSMINIDVNYLLQVPVFKKYYDSK